MDFIVDNGEYEDVTVKEMDAYLSKYLSTDVSKYIQNIYLKFRDGSINSLNFQYEISNILRLNWIAALRIGAGGIENITSSDYGLIGSMLRQEYAWLRQMMQQYENGDITNAQLSSRLDKYALAPRRAYYAGVTASKRRAGYRFEQRFLLDGVKHCKECVGYAQQGKVAIGTLPEPGRLCSCNSNCYCIKVYYRE